MLRTNPRQPRLAPQDGRGTEEFRNVSHDGSCVFPRRCEPDDGMTRIVLLTSIAAPIERCFDLARSVDLHMASTNWSGERAIDLRVGRRGARGYVARHPLRRHFDTYKPHHGLRAN